MFVVRSLYEVDLPCFCLAEGRQGFPGELWAAACHFTIHLHVPEPDLCAGSPPSVPWLYPTPSPEPL